jgi:hypothetical protein
MHTEDEEEEEEEEEEEFDCSRGIDGYTLHVCDRIK